jgi:hypothetical protein
MARNEGSEEMTTASNGIGNRFCGVYGVIQSVADLRQGATPARKSVEDVLSDLVDLRRQGLVLHLVQIIDLETLRPVEPWPRTMERLGSIAARRPAPRTSALDSQCVPLRENSSV